MQAAFMAVLYITQNFLFVWLFFSILWTTNDELELKNLCYCHKIVKRFRNYCVEALSFEMNCFVDLCEQ